MNDLIKQHLPMSETAFYILLSLKEPKHGYAIMQHVGQMTANRIILGAGTLYGTLSKMEENSLIRFVGEESKRKTYEITDVGLQVLVAEKGRLGELYENAKGVLGQ